MHIETTSVFRSRFAGPGAWRAADFSGPQEWSYRLGPALDVEAIRRDLFEGRGFVVIQGVPVDDEAAARRLYLEVTSHFGAPMAQNARGDLLYSVRDEGQSIESQYGTVGVRFSKTNLGLDYHTDAGPMFGGGTADIVGLLCLQEARSGGLSALVSAQTVHNIILEERPDYLERLYQRYYWDRRAELRPGESSVLDAPVFTHDESLAVRHFPFYIHKAPEVTGLPLTEADTAPLAFLDEVMAREGLAAMFAMDRGDIQLVNNRAILHSRTSYEDWPEPERRRHLVRLWLHSPSAPVVQH